MDSRHPDLLRRAGPLTLRRHGRYVRNTLDVPAPPCATDPLAAVPRWAAAARAGYGGLPAEARTRGRIGR
ncbi:hypothetical protein [Streptomyces sp. NPDC092370]|uniref:hypothetical protein n=1 Tax=Streptomyces sp. NPDC092370 TaxID=3366016 RepID=UPI00380B2C3F